MHFTLSWYDESWEFYGIQATGNGLVDTDKEGMGMMWNPAINKWEFGWHKYKMGKLDSTLDSTLGGFWTNIAGKWAFGGKWEVTMPFHYCSCGGTKEEGPQEGVCDTIDPEQAKKQDKADEKKNGEDGWQPATMKFQNCSIVRVGELVDI